MFSCCFACGQFPRCQRQLFMLSKSGCSSALLRCWSRCRSHMLRSAGSNGPASLWEEGSPRGPTCGPLKSQHHRSGPPTENSKALLRYPGISAGAFRGRHSTPAERRGRPVCGRQRFGRFRRTGWWCAQSYANRSHAAPLFLPCFTLLSGFCRAKKVPGPQDCRGDDGIFPVILNFIGL
jgi:hypothetical protein